MSEKSYWLMISSALSVVAALVAAPILTAWLGPDGRGVVYTAIAIGGLSGNVLSLGVDASLRIAYTNRIGRISVRHVLHVAGATVVIYLTAGLFFALDQGRSIPGVAVLAVASAASLLLANGLLTSILIGGQKYLQVGVASLFAPLFQLLVALTAGPLDKNGAIGFLLAAYLASSVLSFLYLSFETRSLKGDSGGSVIKVPIVGSLRNVAPQIIGLVSGKADLILATFLFGATFGGQYSLSIMIAIPLVVIQAALINLYLTSQIRHFETKGRINTAALIVQVKRISSLSAIVGLVSAAVGSALVLPVFGKDFSLAVILCWFTAGSGAVAMVATFTSNVLVASGRGAEGLRVVGRSVAVLVTAAVVSRFLVEGAYVLAILGFYLVAAFQNLRLLGINPWDIRLSLAAAIAAAKDLRSRSS